jgi:C4-dicarboxylate-binding protein DctP
MVVANENWWNGLPEDVRNGLDKAMHEAITYGNKLAKTDDADYRAKVIAAKKAEVIKLTKAEKEEWRNAMKPVWGQFQDEIGKDLIDAAQEANSSK